MCVLLPYFGYNNILIYPSYCPLRHSRGNTFPPSLICFLFYFSIFVSLFFYFVYHLIYPKISLTHLCTSQSLLIPSLLTNRHLSNLLFSIPFFRSNNPYAALAVDKLKKKKIIFYFIAVEEKKKSVTSFIYLLIIVIIITKGSIIHQKLYSVFHFGSCLSSSKKLNELKIIFF